MQRFTEDKVTLYCVNWVEKAFEEKMADGCFQ